MTDQFDLYRQIIWGVHTHSALQSWAIQNFSAQVNTYVGHFPEEYQTPYLMWDLPVKQHGQQLREVIWGFMVFMEITHEGFKTSTEKYFFEPEGVELILDMLTHVKAGIVAALPDGIWGEFSNEEQLISNHPQFFCNLEVRFNQPLTFPNDPMG